MLYHSLSSNYLERKDAGFASKTDRLHVYQIAALTEMVDTAIDLKDHVYSLELPDQDALYLLKEYVRPITSKAIALIVFLHAEDIRSTCIPRIDPDFQMQTTIAECLLTLIAEMDWLTYRIVWEELVDFFPSNDRRKHEWMLKTCSQQSKALYKENKDCFLHYFHINTICADLESIS